LNGYTKTQIHRKTLRKTQKKQLSTQFKRIVNTKTEAR